jgi:hypothetical protein
MIVITALTRNIGNQVLSYLLKAGALARMIRRDASKRPKTVRSRVKTFEGSQDGADIIDRLIARADSLFRQEPPNAKARTADEPHVVFTSIVGPCGSCACQVEWPA